MNKENSKNIYWWYNNKNTSDNKTIEDITNLTPEKINILLSKEELVKKLFFWPQREKLEKYLKNLLEENLIDNHFLEHILSHVGLKHKILPTIEHSKRLRGNMSLLISKGLKLDDESALNIASILELIHQTSLVMDDIQDESEERCEREALWKTVGSKQAAIIEDVMINTFFNIIVDKFHKKDNFIEIYHYFNKLINNMAFWQSCDIDAWKHFHKGTSFYYDNIIKKTAALIEATCYIPSLVHGNIPEETSKKLSQFGYSLGLCHQFEDDIDDIKYLFDNNSWEIDSGNIINFIAYELWILKWGQQKLAVFYLSLKEQEKETLLSEVQTHKTKIVSQLKNHLNNLKSLSIDKNLTNKLEQITFLLLSRNDS